MEKLRTCPICLEVPEKEIYQCLAGHVLCHLCLSKVKVRLCPQCRIPFGFTKIRSRIFEEILDTQEFECKFADKGCNQICKRGEISSHAKACSFNPNTTPLCELVGFKECKFRTGKELSRAEIITHFESTHAKRFKNIGNSESWLLTNAGEFMKEFNNRKRKAGAAKTTTFKVFHLVGLDNSATSPLFVILVQLNYPLGFLSLVCFNIWESGSLPLQTYNAEFHLTKGSSQSSSSLAASVKNPFPIGGSMKVSGLEEAHYLSKSSPINVSMRLLQDSKFGEDENDFLNVNISKISDI